MKFTENRFAICHKPATYPSMRLFCFPSAGAGASQFSKWYERVPAGVEVWSIQLPGREHLFQAPKPNDVEALAGTIRRDITPLLNIPFYFYGHSYGSVVSFELVKQLEQARQNLPNALLVGARRAPHICYEELISGYSDVELVKALDQFGGLPEVLKADAEMLAFYLETIRYDLKLNEKYVVAADKRVPIPIKAFYGVEDDYVKDHQVLAWKNNTANEFSAHAVQGGHFFIAEATAEFYSHLKKVLNPRQEENSDDLIAY